MRNIPAQRVIFATVKRKKNPGHRLRALRGKRTIEEANLIPLTLALSQPGEGIVARKD